MGERKKLELISSVEIMNTPMKKQRFIAIVLVHHNRKAHDSNPNNLISGTNGIAGCADGLLVFTRNGENAKLHISGRGAPALELNLKREKSKWILLDDAPESTPDIFSFTIHDFMLENNSVSGTASDICSMLKQKFPEQEFNSNWLYRDLLQNDDEIIVPAFSAD